MSVSAAKLVNLSRSAALRESIAQSDLVVADGRPLVWLSHLLGCPLPERVTGIDLMYRLLERAGTNSYRIYFLGAEPEVVRRAVTVVRHQYPHAQIAGFHHGYFPAARVRAGRHRLRRQRSSPKSRRNGDMRKRPGQQLQRHGG